MKKKIPKTLKTILQNPLMETIMNRGEKIGPVVDEVLAQWDYDLFKRKPGSAYYVTEDGKTEIETDLDMASFLDALSKRNAVINLPEYNALRPESIKENQVSISKENRHGKLLGVTSNQETFSYGVRFKDAQTVNLLEDDEVGAYRTFLMTNFGGDLYEGYNTLEFVPTYSENKWFYEKGIWRDDPNVKDNSINFKHFVTPNKWLSFYGQHYFIIKALEIRLVEQIKYMKDLSKDMVESGIKYPVTTGRGQYYKDKAHSYGHFDKKTVWCFESEIDYPDNDSTYPTPEYNQTVLVGVKKRTKQLTKQLAKIRYYIRNTELAFANKHGMINGKDIPIKFHTPAWIDSEWQTDYRLKGKQKRWNRLKLMQPAVGELSVSLKFRWSKKTQKIRKGR
jgi:hypothetical protein